MSAVKLRRERLASIQSDHERIAQLAKALAHPARVQIVQTLLRRTTCIGCDIVEEIGLAASTTSEHLRILKSAGFITGEIERPRVCYSLNRDRLLPLLGLLNAVFEKTAPGGPLASTCCPSTTNEINGRPA